MRINVSSGTTTTLEALGLLAVVDGTNPSTMIRIGLYNELTGAPNNLVAQTGAFSSANGVNEQLLVTPIQIAPGAYWIAFNAESQAGPPAVSALRVQVETATTTWYAAAATFGAFPGVFPVASPVTQGIGHIYAVTAP
jgi:hypothetical protein